VKLTIHNSGPNPVPVTGKGWGIVLPGGASQMLDYPDQVWLIGDKDNILENIGKSIKAIADFALKRKKRATTDLTVTLTNTGKNAVRVIPGDTDNETQVSPLDTADLTGTEYIEIRELGTSTHEEPPEAP
jgi:hypothetical protein